jgi:glycine cleavage system H protein
MKKRGFNLRDVFTMVGVLTLVLIALPLAAFIGVFARLPLLLAVALALAIAVVVAAFSPAFRDWLTAEVDQEISYNGLRLATGVATSPYHSWARLTSSEAKVGADDLTQAVLGPIERVELPIVGDHVERGQPLFRLRHGQRSVDVRSPVSGEVVDTNRRLLRTPGLVNQEPYASGWAVRMRTDRRPNGQRGLFRGKDARAWFRLEVDRLLAALTPGVPALPDGGVISQQLHLQIDDDSWDRMRRSFFGPVSVSKETRT